MGEFSTRILEEELTDQNEHGGKDVDGQDPDIRQDGCGVRAPKNKFVGNEESQLAHEPEAECEQDGDGDEQDVGNHWESPRKLVRFFRDSRSSLAAGRRLDSNA